MSTVGIAPPPENFSETGKLVYQAACTIAGIRTAKFTQIARTVPVETVVKESVDLAKLVLDCCQLHHKDLFKAP